MQQASRALLGAYDSFAALLPFREGKGAHMLVFEHDAKPGEPICGTGLCRRFMNAARLTALWGDRAGEGANVIPLHRAT